MDIDLLIDDIYVDGWIDQNRFNLPKIDGDRKMHIDLLIDEIYVDGWIDRNRFNLTNSLPICPK